MPIEHGGDAVTITFGELSNRERIVEAHGRKIAVTEGRDGGARFEITGVEFAGQ